MAIIHADRGKTRRIQDFDRIRVTGVNGDNLAEVMAVKTMSVAVRELKRITVYSLSARWHDISSRETDLCFPKYFGQS